MHALENSFASPQRLSQSVVQAGDLLGLYRAEVARILGIKCQEVGDLYAGRWLIPQDSVQWKCASDFVAIYQHLFEFMHGDGPQMLHWLRKELPELGDSPFILMVDQGRAAEVLAWLKITTDTD